MKTRSRIRFLGLEVLAVVMSTMGMPGPGALPLLGQEPPPETVFEEGNRRYQGNDFAGALAAYREVLDRGFESAELFYNLGNAYFKTGDLGRSILSWERALRLRPRDRDAQANLELARSLTADEVEPLPRFWLLSVGSWWVNLLPGRALFMLSILAYFLATGGLSARILSREPIRRRLSAWVLLVGVGATVLFGGTFLAREGVLGGTEWGIVLAESVPVRSAPSAEEDLTLFVVHEGARVRIDQKSDTWFEVVLEDGKVGWIPAAALEII
jgi:hypothetical protein